MNKTLCGKKLAISIAVPSMSALLLRFGKIDYCIYLALVFLLVLFIVFVARSDLDDKIIKSRLMQPIFFIGIEFESGTLSSNPFRLAICIWLTYFIVTFKEGGEFFIYGFQLFYTLYWVLRNDNFSLERFLHNCPSSHVIKLSRDTLSFGFTAVTERDVSPFFKRGGDVLLSNLKFSTRNMHFLPGLKTKVGVWIGGVGAIATGTSLGPPMYDAGVHRIKHGLNVVDNKLENLKSLDTSLNTAFTNGMAKSKNPIHVKKSTDTFLTNSKEIHAMEQSLNNQKTNPFLLLWRGGSDPQYDKRLPELNASVIKATQDFTPVEVAPLTPKPVGILSFWQQVNP